MTMPGAVCFAVVVVCNTNSHNWCYYDLHSGFFLYDCIDGMFDIMHHGSDQVILCSESANTSLFIIRSDTVG